ncbi:SDR family NAD(P)-dependent oxidoreductase [Kitasatospora sp. NPDC057541]|uniref:SDR family NAD(P)-dependent oxidoreductase n=1 Tax=Kitasatospora sp. NPDC057541 TaxID=3346161 RepID=UPI0036947223
MTTRSDPPSRTAVVTVAVAGPGPDAGPVDGTAPEACEAVAARAEEGFGPVHGRVDGAFAGVVTPFADAAAAEFRRVAELTYLGCVNGTRAALHRMLPRARGTVVQVGPAIAHRGIPPRSAHGEAEHAGGRAAAIVSSDALAPGPPTCCLPRTGPSARPADGPPSAEDRVRLWRPADGGRGLRPWAGRRLGHRDPFAPARGSRGCRP